MEFETITEVPIFHSCREFPKPGDMVRIAEKANANAKAGTTPTIFVGHADRDEKPAVGVLSDFRATNRGGVETLTASLNFYKDVAPEIRRSFPNRSIEITRNGTVTGLAVLGSSLPALNLGLAFSSAEKPLKFSADMRTKQRRKAREKEKFIYELIDTPMESNIDESKPLTLGDVKQLLEAWDVTAWVRAEMAKQAMADVQEAPEAPAQEAVSEEAPAAPAEEQPAPEASEAPAEAMPEEAQAPADEAAPEEDSEEDIKKAYAELKLKYTLATREKVLMSLQGEGIALSIEEELDGSLSDEQFDSQVSRIRKNYSRLPVSKFSAATRKPVDGESEWNRIRDYATANGITYTEAKNRLQGVK